MGYVPPQIFIGCSDASRHRPRKSEAFYFAGIYDPRKVSRGNVTVDLEYKARLVLLALLARGSVTTNDLVEVVYGPSENGGPLSVKDCIHEHVMMVRQAGAALGFRVVNNGRFEIEISHGWLQSTEAAE